MAQDTCFRCSTKSTTPRFSRHWRFACRRRCHRTTRSSWSAPPAPPPRRPPAPPPTSALPIPLSLSAVSAAPTVACSRRPPRRPSGARARIRSCSPTFPTAPPGRQPVGKCGCSTISRPPPGSPLTLSAARGRRCRLTSTPLPCPKAPSGSRRRSRSSRRSLTDGPPSAPASTSAPRGCTRRGTCGRRMATSSMCCNGMPTRQATIPARRRSGRSS